MHPLSRDYDADPRRFLATDEHPHDDVHPYVAARFAVAALYHYADPVRAIRAARRVLRPGGLFAACAPNRDSTPELARVIPGWGTGTTFDGEDAAGIVASVFCAPGDTVETDRWDGPLVTLGSAADAAAFLRVHRLDEAAAGALDLPMTLTMRGCVVYATKARSER